MRFQFALPAAPPALLTLILLRSVFVHAFPYLQEITNFANLLCVSRYLIVGTIEPAIDNGGMTAMSAGMILSLY